MTTSISYEEIRWGYAGSVTSNVSPATQEHIAPGHPTGNRGEEPAGNADVGGSNPPDPADKIWPNVTGENVTHISIDGGEPIPIDQLTVGGGFPVRWTEDGLLVVDDDE